MKLSKYRYLVIMAILAVISVFAVQSVEAHDIQNNSGAILTTTGPCGDRTDDVNGSDQSTQTECPDAEVSVDLGTCRWDAQNQVSTTNVLLNIFKATVTISDSNGVVGVFTSDQSVTLPEGSYTYSWVSVAGYQGSGSGSFTLLNCEPEKGDVTVSVADCSFNQNDGSLTNVSLIIQNATLTIAGFDWSSSTTIKLAPGTYAYSWTAAPGYEGSGSGSITVSGCEPASAGIELGTCDWGGEIYSTSALIYVYDATLTLKVGESVFGTYGPGVYDVELPEGSYTFTWEANEGFTGSGSGSFTLLGCEPTKADASVDLGSCSGDNNQPYADISITISNAILTIDGKQYTETTVLQLEPGDYPYSWEASSEEFSGSGEGVLTVVNCVNQSVDPSPDVAAGGMGPSVVNSVAPLLAGVAGLGLASIFLVKGKKEN